MTDTTEAQDLLDSRLAVYGERVKNMENVAKVFSGILGIEVRPDQVPLLMVGYKTVRASQTPDYEDNVKDIEGYAIMFREIIGDDMVAAVNTDEYLAEKARRAQHAVVDSILAEHNRHVRAYNGRYSDEAPAQPTEAEAARLLKEVPSYQPGPGTGHNNRAAYQQQLTDIFRRAWKGQSPIIPAEKFAEAAAHEAVEYFWLTFQRNAELEASIRELKEL